METITLTIPACNAGYKHTAAMLLEMAGEQEVPLKSALAQARREAKLIAEQLTGVQTPVASSETPNSRDEVTSAEEAESFVAKVGAGLIEAVTQATFTAPEPSTSGQGAEVYTPPPPPAQTVTDETQGPSGPDVETDKTGRPWDERIDSSNHKKTADDLWMRRRNVPQETYDAVVAELMGADAQPTPPPPPPPPAPPAPAPAAPASSGEPITFIGLVNKITSARLNQAIVTAACIDAGLSGLSQLASKPDAIKQVHDALFPNG